MFHSLHVEVVFSCCPAEILGLTVHQPIFAAAVRIRA